MAIDYVNSSKEATQGEGWTQVAEFKSKGKEIVKGGVKFEVVSHEEQKTFIMKRIGVIALTCLFAGLLLINDRARSIVFSGNDVHEFAVPVSVRELELKEEKIQALESLKEKISPICQSTADKVIKAVSLFGAKGLAFGSVSAGVVLTAMSYALPNEYALVALHMGISNIFAAGVIGSSIACGTYQLGKILPLKDTAKIIAGSTIASAAVGTVTYAASADPRIAVATSLFIGTVTTAQMIFNHYAAKGNARIAELNQKIAALSA